jgi:uncharacterized protein YggE
VIILENKVSILNPLIFVVLIAVAIFFAPLKNINWGNLKIGNSEVVTVTGSAKTQQKSQIATFTAGVNVYNDSKETAVAEANKKINEITAKAKEFGIDANDIQTQNMSVYQAQDNYWEDGRQKFRPGQWSVNNDVTITLRSVDRAGELYNALSATGATNIYGPNYQADDQKELEAGLIEQAIKDATDKATTMANIGGRKLGKIVTIQEGSTTSGIENPVFYSKMDTGGGGGAAPEPGSQTISKQVTVTFELK